MSENSIGISVGHQQIAKFLLSMLFNLEFSDTLFGLKWKKKIKIFMLLVLVEQTHTATIE